MSDKKQISPYVDTQDFFCDGLLDGEYKVRKTIVSYKMVEPINHIDWEYKYTLAVIGEHRELFGDDADISDELKVELATFCPDISKQKFYFFNQVYKDGVEQPLFYGLIAQESTVKKGLITNPLSKFVMAVQDKIKDMIFYERISSSFNINFILYRSELADLLKKFVDLYCNQEVDKSDKEDIAVFADIIRRYEIIIKQEKNLPIKYYIKAVLESFYRFIEDNKMAVRCINCGKIVSYRRNKRYCDESCLRSLANKKYYKLNKKSKTL